ncbi:MAG: MFS transporter [Dehalococcoidia bacterium]|nr:MFS transporter [Dehalococcoidia bacterium]
MRIRHLDPNGWLLVAACFVVTLCIGEVLWSFGVFFKSLETEFGWSRGLTSSGYTGLVIAQGMSAIIAGRLADRYKPRRVLLASACIAGPAIMACSQITTLPQLQLLLIVTGIGAGATVSVPVSTVQKYFSNTAQSNIALAIVASGIGMGALVFAPLLNAVIHASGWRTAFITAGLIFSALVGSAALVLRPTGMQLQKRGNQSAAANSRVRDLIITPQFMGVTGVFMVAVFAFQTLSVHLVPYATDIGIKTGAAAVALGMVGGLSVPGRLTSGLLSQKLGWGKTLAFSLAGCGLAITTLPAIHTEWMLYSFVAFYGFCHGVRAVATFGTVGRLFGGRSLGELTGILVACSNFVGAFGPYVAGRVFDLTGSYGIMFTSVGILLLVVALASLTIQFESREA